MPSSSPTSSPPSAPPYPVMTWIGRPCGRCAFVNEGWLHFTGTSLVDHMDDGWRSTVHRDDLDALLDVHRRVLKDQRPALTRFRLRHHEGDYVPLRLLVSPRFDDHGTLVGLLANAESLGETSFDSMYAFAEDIFDMTLDSVCVAGFDGYFKRVNPSWVKTLGWSVEELLQSPILEFVHPEDRDAVVNARTTLHGGNTLHHLINRYICKDGSIRWMEWKSVAHLDRQLVYAVARDITDQKLAEEELRASRQAQEKMKNQLVFADRMASVGTLAAGVAHEVNNPLTYVTTNIALMQQKLGGLDLPADSLDVDALREMAGEAQAGAERIRTIVSSLKTFSRSEDESLAIIDLVPLIDMSINMTANEIRHRARLVKNLSPLPHVEADEARLGQVFVNLLINAAQAIPDDDAHTHEICVSTSTSPDGSAHIEFHDTGPGIPADVLPRIFDPFFTTRPVGVGTGLGLSICHSIVTQLRGTITVTSVVGRGTTFVVSLPPSASTPAPLPTAPTTPPETSSTTNAASVLIVDDEPAIGRVLRRALWDHSVHVVTSAREALNVLREGRRFDIIFSDLMMPEMSGMEFFEHLQTHLPGVSKRVVFISGGAFTTRARTFLEAVPNPSLEKPFDLRALKELVQRYAAESSED